MRRGLRTAEDVGPYGCAWNFVVCVTEGMLAGDDGRFMNRLYGCARNPTFAHGVECVGDCGAPRAPVPTGLRLIGDDRVTHK